MQCNDFNMYLLFYIATVGFYDYFWSGLVKLSRGSCKDAKARNSLKNEIKGWGLSGKEIYLRESNKYGVLSEEKLICLIFSSKIVKYVYHGYKTLNVVSLDLDAFYVKARMQTSISSEARRNKTSRGRENRVSL